MSRDYASRANSKAKKADKRTVTKQKAKKSHSAKAKSSDVSPMPTPSNWLFVAVIVVLFLGGLSYLKNHRQTPIVPEIAQPAKVKPQLAQRIPSEPEFDFYTILPKERVWIPKYASNQSNTTTNEAGMPTAYIVQLAAFEQQTTATEFKTKLLKEGYAAMMDSKPVNGWYRVWVGPIKTLAQAQAVQTKIVQTDHTKGMVLQVPIN